jgi:hypothetical protein
MIYVKTTSEPLDPMTASEAEVCTEVRRWVDYMLSPEFAEREALAQVCLDVGAYATNEQIARDLGLPAWFYMTVLAEVAEHRIHAMLLPTVDGIH